jgi:hypothetical protein
MITRVDFSMTDYRGDGNGRKLVNVSRTSPRISHRAKEGKRETLFASGRELLNN